MTRVLRARPAFELCIPPRTLQPVTPLLIQRTIASASAFALYQPQSTFCATLVADGLYLGSHADAAAVEDLQRLGITHVLNVAAECEPAAQLRDAGVRVLHVKLRDHSDEDIAAHFDECHAFIRAGLQAGGAVLVHCRMGVSRSATIVTSYLMKHGFDRRCPATTSFTDAFRRVKERRCEVSPNIGFSFCLRELDTTLGFRASALDDCFGCIADGPATGGAAEGGPWAFTA